mmetsp:Transcript_19139/g.39039  ORF Transcript_19139/g.39039 Transcript_19139/m.39039 type:complete len:157 (+) Transcript_19139:102-572(+)
MPNLPHSKSMFERWVRSRTRLPKHCTANDDAAVLLRLSVMALTVSGLVSCSCPWYAVWFSWFTASAFIGLSLQQYAWYTAKISVDCWSDEGFPVVAVISLSAMMIGFLSFVLAALLPPWTRLLGLTILHVGILTSVRWSFWGSLFDGTDKARARAK